MPARLAVADTGPLNYLVLTEDIELLPRLFARVCIPAAVRDELAHFATPFSVRKWLASEPSWLLVCPDPNSIGLTEALVSPDRGEQAAIALALAMKADILLIDDREGAALARQDGLAVTGTLGILDLAAQRGMLDLAAAFDRLKKTNFYYRQGLLDTLLARYDRRNNRR
jgi:predicted nucleic acid-binding protein